MRHDIVLEGGQRGVRALTRRGVQDAAQPYTVALSAEELDVMVAALQASLAVEDVLTGEDHAVIRGLLLKAGRAKEDGDGSVEC